jgi:hypothetical protein
LLLLLLVLVVVVVVCGCCGCSSCCCCCLLLSLLLSPLYAFHWHHGGSIVFREFSFFFVAMSSYDSFLAMAVEGPPPLQRLPLACPWLGMTAPPLQMPPWLDTYGQDCVEHVHDHVCSGSPL